MMRALLTNLRCQIAMAARIGLIGGAAIGLLLGAMLLALRNAPLLLGDGVARAWLPVLIGALCVWLSVALLQPLALLLACALTIWPKLQQLRVRRLYARALAAAALFVWAALWVAFRLVRDVTAPRSLAMLVGVAILSCMAFLLPPWRRAGAPTAERGVLVAVGLMLALVLGIIAYGNLAARSDAPRAYAHAAPPAARASGHDAARPADVILVSIDTLRADHLSANGYPRHTTPQLDQLAADGIDFLDAHSQAPWTLPSHAAMVTGKYPSSCGVRFAQNFRFVSRGAADTLAASNLTLAEALHAVGYRTAAFTSTDYLTALFGFDQGFDEMEQVDPSKADHAATVVDKGIDCLAADGNRPAFLFLHVYTVHQYASPAAYDALYQDPAYHGPLRDQPLMTAANLYDSLTDADLHYLVAKYDGALRYVDDELGRLFAWLRAQGRYDHTLLVVTADHGEEFWDHGGTGHGFTLYEEQLRVPLIIKPPAGAAVHDPRSQVLAGLIDLAPTILDYVGLPRPAEMDGTTLRPTIETAANLDRPLFAEATFFFNSYATVGGKYKYIDNRVPPLEPLNVGLLLANLRSFYRFRDDELYELESDPAERTNLIGLRPAVASDRRRALLAHIRAAPPGEAVALDAATRERLRALGYVH